MDSSLKMAEQVTLAIADYIVIAVVLTVCLAVGIYLAVTGRKNSSKEDYLVGNRQLSLYPVAFSLFVTYMSGTSLIGFPAESYTTGSDIFILSLAVGLAFLLGMFTVIPVLHPLKVTSLYEYFELRFDSYGLRLLVTVISMIQKIIYTSVVLLSPALAVQTISNLPFWVSVVIIGSVGIIYTSIGMMAIGGLERTWILAKDGNRIQPIDFDPDPRVRHSFWALVLGGVFGFFGFSFDQSAVQRISSIPTVNGARIAYAINIFIVSLYTVLVCFIGIVAYSYFATVGCDPFKSGALTNRNQLVPYFMMQIFHDLPGMAGLFLASLFSGTLSTVSSVINGLAANTIEDLLSYPFKKFNISENGKILTAKLAVCFYGAVCIGLAFVSREFPGSVVQTAVALVGAFAGPVAGLFFLGATFPWSNKIGAYIGVLVSVMFTLWLSVGGVLYGQRPGMLPPAPGNSCSILESGNITFSSSMINVTSVTDKAEYVITTEINKQSSGETEAPPKTVYDISYQYYGLVGFLCTLIVGLVVSSLTFKWCDPVRDEKYYFPCFRQHWKRSDPYTVAATEDNSQIEMKRRPVNA